MREMQRSTARDFRINAAKVQEAIAEAEEDEEDEDEDDGKAPKKAKVRGQ